MCGYDCVEGVCDDAGVWCGRVTRLTTSKAASPTEDTKAVQGARSVARGTTMQKKQSAFNALNPQNKYCAVEMRAALYPDKCLVAFSCMWTCSILSIASLAHIALRLDPYLYCHLGHNLAFMGTSRLSTSPSVAICRLSLSEKISVGACKR